ncbi:MAG: hypothetical protein LBV53_00335 [Mycoplasmataceae bacterium]|nr:hypothetical protein [Mycoplasmataceae bacterium]
MRYYSQKKSKTKPWLTTLVVAILFAVYLVCYFLFFQGNALRLEWLIANNGIVWSGKINNEATLNWLNSHYKLNLDASNIGKYLDIKNTTGTIFSLNALWIILGLIAFTIILLLILKFTKVINYDSYIFVIAILFSYIVFLMSDLIPHWEKNDIGRTIIIIAIAGISLILSFLLLSKIFNNVMLNSNNSFDIKQEYESEEKDSQEGLSKINKAIDDAKKEEYIEI